MSRVPPHDIDAERALIGDLLTTFGSRVGEVAVIVLPEDFYDRTLACVYAAVLSVWNAGVRPGVEVVRDELRRQRSDITDRFLFDLSSAGGGGFVRWAQRIATHALARRLIAVCESTATDAFTADPVEVLDGLKASLANLDVPLGRVPDDLWVLDEFMDRPQEAQRPWAIPGLLRNGWRAMLVAPEGMGKSVAFRQVAVCGAQGIHPFSFERIPRVRTLLVDLENPAEAITDVCQPIRVQARLVAGDGYEPGRAWLWHRPGGIDLRQRGDRADFEAVVAHCKPDLVCLGPVYKAYRVKARENDELAAGEVQAVFDDLRTRYGFALMLEHHAPKKQAGVRELLPYGSSLWLRWPEFGLKLVPDDEKGHRLRVERWRGDRLRAAWPDVLERGREWPWVGVWNDGYRSEGAA